MMGIVIQLIAALVIPKHFIVYTANNYCHCTAICVVSDSNLEILRAADGSSHLMLMAVTATAYCHQQL